MKYVVVPASVVVLDSNGTPLKERNQAGEEKAIPDVSLHRYLMQWVIFQTKVEGEGQQARLLPKIGHGYEGNKRIGKLDRAFAKAKAGDIVGVDGDDWQRVSDIIRDMLLPNAWFASRLEPLEDAWMRAWDSKELAEKAVRELRGEGSKPEALPAKTETPVASA